MDAREFNPALTRTNEGENDCDRRHGREGIRPSSVRGGALPNVGTAPALAEGTASIVSASGAEKAAAARPEALEP